MFPLVILLSSHGAAPLQPDKRPGHVPSGISPGCGLWVAEECGEASGEALCAFTAEHYVRGAFPVKFLDFLYFLEPWDQPEPLRGSASSI